MATKKATPPRKTTRQQSKKSFVTLSPQKRLYWLIAILAILSIGALGVVRLMPSKADTFALSSESCHVRGRYFSFPDGNCHSICLDGAGQLVNNPGGYDYCARAVSTTMGKEKCNSLGRQMVGSVGCARRWQQTNAKQAIQCMNNNDTYHVADPYDFCSGAGSASWVWPVPSTHHLGVLSWGESGSKGIHKGIDIGISGGASLGAKVVAAHAGTVVYTKNTGACGEFILIDLDGYSSKWIGYQHMSTSGVAVSAGQHVAAGQTLGSIGPAGGSTCGSSGFYHLHFSVENTAHISTYSDPLSLSANPLNYLPD